MEPWYELLKRERTARLMTQQEAAQAIGTDARTLRAWEGGHSFPSKYFRRKLCAFYGKEAKDLGLDEETAIQQGKQMRDQKNSDVIIRESVLPLVEEFDGSSPPTLVETKMEPGPDAPISKNNRHIPDDDASWRLPPWRRTRVHPLQVGGAILVVVLIVAALLWSRGVLSLHSLIILATEHTNTTNPQSPAPRTPAPGPALFFGFDGSTQGWGTSEEAFKLARVSDANSPVFSGSGSLEVTSALIGTGSPLYPGNSVYTHTEATDYFSPHNFGGASGGATVTCYVYLPPGLAPGGTSPGYIRVFVKDTQYRNDFSDAITIGPSTVGRWVRLSFVIGANLNNEDRGFDASKVYAIGIRIDLNNGSRLDYTGPFYIDACSLQWEAL